MHETWCALQLDSGNKYGQRVQWTSGDMPSHRLVSVFCENKPGASVDMSEAGKLGVDLASVASSLTKKKEEPTT